MMTATEQIHLSISTSVSEHQPTFECRNQGRTRHWAAKVSAAALDPGCVKLRDRQRAGISAVGGKPPFGDMMGHGYRDYFGRFPGD
jgi:hypothetical protein